nr:unnamed protein product [Digitaria exilis]
MWRATTTESGGDLGDAALWGRAMWHHGGGSRSSVENGAMAAWTASEMLMTKRGGDGLTRWSDEMNRVCYGGEESTESLISGDVHSGSNEYCHDPIREVASNLCRTVVSIALSDAGFVDYKLAKSLSLIQKAGIGGPLIDLSGKFMGMNFYEKNFGTPFLWCTQILSVLASFKKERYGYSSVCHEKYLGFYNILRTLPKYV